MSALLHDYPMMYVMLPPPHEETHACENITFPQLLWVKNTGMCRLYSAMHKAAGLKSPGHSMALPGTIL